MQDRPNVYLFDLDGTLTREELLPKIAVAAGLPSIEELTRRTMAGEIPFQESFRRRVELLSRVPVELIAEVVASAPIHERLMDWISDHREQCWVVTGNIDRWVMPWLDHWGLRAFTSTSSFVDNRVRLAPDGILEKIDVLSNFAGYRTVMVGDGANDAAIVGAVDFGIAAQLIHAAPDVLIESADCIVNSEESLCRVLSRL
ncbi:MAG TPA: HAD-IB family phosphatase [Galbitalea sp.]|nr:HAD-IB family phosphatase [Galbitalea sp.]